MTTRSLVTPDGVSLFVNEIGASDLPPAVVLHGGPAANHDYLLPAFANLADLRRLVLYDQRGSGRSPAPHAEVGFDAQLADVGTVIDDAAGGRADLIGYSFGGLLAMIFAARHPAKVRKLVLVSSAPPWSGARAEIDRAMAAAQANPWIAAERAALDRSGLRESVPQEHRRRRFSLSVAGYFADPRLCYALTPFLMNARTAETIYDSLGAFDFRAEIAGLGANGPPALFVHGDRDPIPAVRLAETAALAGARFELLAGSGHVPYVEAAGPFFSILRAFLGDIA